MGDEPRACSLCGAPAPDDAPSRQAWTSEFDAQRGPLLICPDCTRTYLRSIEARLDQEWW